MSTINYQEEIPKKKEIYDKIQRYCIEELRAWRAANSVTLVMNILNELHLHPDDFRNIKDQIMHHRTIIIKNQYYDYDTEHEQYKECYVRIVRALKNIKTLCLKELETFGGGFSMDIATHILEWLGLSDEEFAIILLTMEKT